MCYEFVTYTFTANDPNAFPCHKNYDQQVVACKNFDQQEEPVVLLEEIGDSLINIVCIIMKAAERDLMLEVATQALNLT